MLLRFHSLPRVSLIVVGLVAFFACTACGSVADGKRGEFEQRMLVQTGNSLDVAVEGDGFFQVRRSAGGVAYTRRGTLRVDADGRLITSDGYPIEPIVNIPTAASQIEIQYDGIVTVIQPGSSTAKQVGQILLSVFVNEDGLAPIGQDLYVSTGVSGRAWTGFAGCEGRGTIVRGALELLNEAPRREPQRFTAP